MGELTVVRNYKDTVFRMLFKDRKELLELYNALNGTDYQEPEDLEITTLENAIYIGMKNDISFILESELNLYEQQSTYNPNMPLRDLFYVSVQLEKLTNKKDLHSSRLVRIPVPRFVVFYNGKRKSEEKEVLLLSNAYEKRTEDPELELKVTMLNINYGHNRELMEKCRPLFEYSVFVRKVREYKKTMRIEEAVPKAVDDCIEENILREFLIAQRAEVIAMSIFEYNEEVKWEKMRKSEYEYGKGEGKAEGRAEDIIALLGRKGEVSQELHQKVIDEKDETVLLRWLILAAETKSIEEFAEKMKCI